MEQSQTSTIRERGRLETLALPSDAARLHLLCSISESLVSHLELEQVLAEVLDALQRLFRYDRCAVVGRLDNGDLHTWASRPGDAPVPFSRTVVQRVLERGEALLYDDIQGQAPFDLGESIVGLKIRSVLCSPSVSRGKVRGLIYLDRSTAGAYDLEDLALLRGVSAQIAVAIENARLYGELRERYTVTAADLREKEKRLIEAERKAVLGRLVPAIAHEVRNPVMVIGGLARRLARQNAAGPDLGAVTDIREEAERLERMVGRVEALQSLPAAAVRPGSLRPAVEAALAECSATLGGAGVRAEPQIAASGEVPHDPVLSRIALVAVLEYLAGMVAPGSVLRVATAPPGEGWAVVLGADAAGASRPPPGPVEPGAETEPWSLDLGLALAQRAMAEQGGDLRVEACEGRAMAIRLLWPAVEGAPP